MSAFLSFFSFHGTVNRSSFLLTLLMSYALAACVYVSLFRYIDPWVLFGIATLALLPLFVRRFNDSGLSWTWLLSTLICLFPLVVFFLAIFIIQKRLEEPYKISFGEVLLIYSAIWVVCLLVWRLVNRNIFRIVLILTFFTAPLWLLYQLLIAKSLKEDDVSTFDLDGTQVDRPSSNRLSIKLLYFSFSGRLSRSEFWLYGMMPYAIFSIVIATIYLPFTNISSQWTAFFSAISLILTLLLAIPSLALLVKRLHDLNKSAWWLGVLIVPVLGALYLLFITACYRGNEGGNHYGEESGDAALDSFYHRALSYLGKVRQSAVFNHFAMLSVGIILVLLARNLFALFDSSIRQLSDVSDFGITGFILQMLFNVLYIVCVITVSVFGMKYVNKDSTFKISMLLFSIILFILAWIFWINDGSLYYALTYVFNRLEVLLIFALLLLFIAKRGEKSALFIAGLSMAVYGGMIFLYMLLQLVDGFHSAYYFLMYFSLLEIGLFLMYVDHTSLSKISPVENDAGGMAIA
jgi:uncharacterized membrane protein YhaH (DUF805 family)